MIDRLKALKALNFLEQEAADLNKNSSFEKRGQNVLVSHYIKTGLRDFNQIGANDQKLEYMLLVSLFILAYKHVFGKHPAVKSLLKNKSEEDFLPLFFYKYSVGTTVKTTIINIEKHFRKNVLLLHESNVKSEDELVNEMKRLFDSKNFIGFNYSGFTQNCPGQDLLNITVQKEADGLSIGLASTSKGISEDQLSGLAQVMEGYIVDLKKQLDCTISEMPLLSDIQQQKMLSLGNRAASPVDEEIFIKQFINIAEKYPDRVALQFRNKDWTYRELNRESSKIACFLQQRFGVKTGNKVGVLLRRDEKLLMTLLAIQKAGASYVPLDTNYPEKRIKFIHDDSNVDVLIANRVGGDTSFEYGNNVFVEEMLDADIAVDNFVAATCEPSEDFYLIYTSGSTGFPKGCRINQVNVMNLFTWAREHFSKSELSRVLASTSICFDLSIFELFLPLTVGGTVVLVENLMDLLIRDKKVEVSLINSIPSLVQELVNHNCIPSTVETLNLAGEPIQKKLINGLRDITSIKKIWNLYGPSETTTYSTGTQLAHGGFDGNCIGTALNNTALLVLNERLKPVPFGVPGELYIGGMGVSNGYWNRDELNRERFIKIPGLEHLGVFYKTGDSVAWNTEGVLKFMGRLDNQVKVRGFRIELDEVEHALMSLDKIEQAKVVVLGKSNKVKIVACYQGKEIIERKQLYALLSKKLPAYMIPQDFIYLESIFRTPNGKIDVKRIKEYCTKTNEVSYVYDGDNEVLLFLIEESVKILGHNNVLPESNLYTLGFSSIDFIKLLVRIEKKYGYLIKASTLLKKTTINDIVAVIENSPENVLKIPLTKAIQKELYPATFAQKRFWLNVKFNQENSELFCIPIIISWQKELDLDRLENAWNRVKKRYEILRTNFVFESQELYQKITPYKYQKLEIVRELTTLKKVEKDSFFKAITDLEHDELARMKVIQDRDSSSYLLLNFHHSIIDGWSVSIILNALLEYYRSPELAIEEAYQFKDYSEYIYEVVQKNTDENALAHWKRKLESVNPSISFFQKVSEEDNNEGAVLNFTIEKARFEKFKAFLSQKNCSLFQGVISLFGVLFRRYGNHSNLLIGMPAANRFLEELEELPGLFMNVVVFNLDVQENIAYDVLLNQLKDEITETLDYQNYPIDIALKDRSDKEAPLFEVFIAHQYFGLTREQFLEPGVEFKTFPITNAKHPLSIYFEETAGELSMVLEFQTARILKSEVQTMIAHFNILMNEVIGKSTEKIDNLNILDEKEQLHLLQIGNNYKNDLKQEYNLYKLFEKKAQKAPHNRAVNHKGGNFNYGYCLNYANEVHKCLSNNSAFRKNGAKKVVAIDVPEGIQRIGAILGTLKAGGIVLILPQDLPDNGKKLLLEESKSTVRIGVEGNHLFSTCDYVKMPAYYADEVYLKTEEVKSDDGAWLIFTSGSTAKPKGALLTHRNLGCMLNWFVDYFKLNSDSVLPQKTNTSFVDSIVETLAPVLITGGTVFLKPSASVIHNMLELYQWLSEVKVSHVQFVPEIFDLFYKENNKIPSSLQHLLLSGNTISKFYDLPCNIYNVYGASETTAYTIVSKISSEEDLPIIGMPAEGTKVKIVNENGQLCPVNVKGELYIAGNMIFKGYVNQTEQPLFWDDEEQIFWYKTNDIVSWTEDQKIYFHNRKGNIVKVKGVRINLAEIEYIAEKMIGVEKAIAKVLKKEDSDILMLFLQTVADLTLKEVQEVMKSELPSYKRPLAYRLVTSFDFNSSGKIDRSKLNWESGKLMNSGYEYVASSTPTEKQLVSIIKNIVDLPAISVEDNYFDIGIDSLRLVALEKEISKTFFAIALTDFFSYPNIRSLASFIDQHNLEAIDLRSWETNFESSVNRNLTQDHYETISFGIENQAIDVLNNLSDQYQVTITPLINAFACYAISLILDDPVISFMYATQEQISGTKIDFDQYDSQEVYIDSFLKTLRADKSRLDMVLADFEKREVKRNKNSLVFLSVNSLEQQKKLQAVSDLLLRVEEEKYVINITWRSSYISEAFCLKISEIIMKILLSFKSVVPR